MLYEVITVPVVRQLRLVHADQPVGEQRAQGRPGRQVHRNHDYEKSRELESQAREIAIANHAEAAIAYAHMVRDERELVHGRGLDDDGQRLILV